jgi:hypothetical protein
MKIKKYVCKSKHLVAGLKIEEIDGIIFVHLPKPFGCLLAIQPSKKIYITQEYGE